MIPPFNKDGNLPPGVYDASIAEVEQRFGYNQTRRLLVQKLKLLLRDLKSAGCKTLYLNGSFITSKELPGDYDACWDSDGVDNTIEPMLRDINTFRIERKQKYGGDIFFRIPELSVDHFYFFQRDSRTEKVKGIIRIQLGLQKK